MNPLFVVIAAAGHDAEALLAAEALRHAADSVPWPWKCAPAAV